MKCQTNSPLTISNTILERAFIEEVGWKLSQLRVHTVLYGETERSDTQNNQPLK